MAKEDLNKLITKESQKQIEELARMEAKLSRQALALQRELYEIIREKFLDSLQRDKAGNLLYNTTNLNRINDMVKTWEYFREQNFRPEVLNFGKDLLSIVDVEAGYFLALGKDFNIPFEFDKVRDLISKQIGITLDKSPQIIPGSYLDRLLEGTQVQDKVTNIVLENVSAKGSFAKLKTDLSEAIKGTEAETGAMERYLRTYAYDTFSTVQASIDLNLADTYDLNWFVYSGDIVKESREFCIEHLWMVLSREECEELDGMDWQGKNWDVPFLLSRGGYNCRHILRPIPEEGKEYFREETA